MAVSTREWLLDEYPHSRLQAELGGLYRTFLALLRNPLAVIGGVIILVLLVMGLFAPWIAPFPSDGQDLANRLAAPGSVHWMGTDELGRDIFSRIVFGARITLTIVLLVAVIAAPIGLVVGAIAGYAGGWTDRILMGITDIFLSMPKLILALAFVAALGPGIENAIIAIAITTWPAYARIARAETLTFRHSEFIAAIQLQGASAARIVLRHILPLCTSSMIIRVTLDMAGPAAAAGMGGDDLAGPHLHLRSMVGGNHARHCHRRRQPRFLLPRRRLARRARSPPGRQSMSGPILQVEDLRVSFPSLRGDVDVVDGISFDLGRERLGIVGESGSGKSMTGRSILRLVRAPGKVTAKRMMFDGIDLMSQSERQMRAIRGARISMVMQDPKFSLNPVMTVGAQIAEALKIHTKLSGREIRARVFQMLEAVRINDPERVFDLYPHEISGGMGQRVMIAMMLIPEPDLLIADEPTSALDVSVQAEVLGIIDELVTRRGMGLILISHDLGLVSRYCDRILVMNGGRIVEECVASKLSEAQHPYTRGLLAAMPRMNETREELPVLLRSQGVRT